MRRSTRRPHTPARYPCLAQPRSTASSSFTGILSNEWIVERFYPSRHPRTRAADRLRREASDPAAAVRRTSSTPSAPAGRLRVAAHRALCARRDRDRACGMEARQRHQAGRCSRERDAWPAPGQGVKLAKSRSPDPRAMRIGALVGWWVIARPASLEVGGSPLPPGWDVVVVAAIFWWRGQAGEGCRVVGFAPSSVGGSGGVSWSSLVPAAGVLTWSERFVAVRVVGRRRRPRPTLECTRSRAVRLMEAARAVADEPLAVSG